MSAMGCLRGHIPVPRYLYLEIAQFLPKVQLLQRDKSSLPKRSLVSGGGEGNTLARTLLGVIWLQHVY